MHPAATLIPFVLTAALVATTPQQAVKQYQSRLRSAQETYVREASAARKELISDLQTVESRLKSAGKVDGVIKIREALDAAQKQLLTAEDLVRRLHGTKYKWSRGTGMYQFQIRGGRLYGWLENEKPLPVVPVDHKTLRRYRSDGTYVEWTFASDLGVFLYTDGTAVRTGTRVD